MQPGFFDGCLFCGGDLTAPDHWRTCDGRQGGVEAGLPFSHAPDAPEFDGDTYEPELDHERLGAQALRVWAIVCDARWRTLAEIEALCGDPQASISARLRDFRKSAFGAHTVERQRRGDAERGLFEYRITPQQRQGRGGVMRKIGKGKAAERGQHPAV